MPRDVAGPAYRAAVLKYPKHNVQLRHGARIIELIATEGAL
jgi:hypothetical protein